MALAYRPVISPSTAMNHIVTGAGVYYADIDLSIIVAGVNFKTVIDPFLMNAAQRAKQIGSMRGGGSFTAQPILEELPIDTLRIYPQILRGWTVTLASTMLSINAENYRKLAPLEIDTASGAMIASDTIADHHYIKNVVHVGERMGNRGFQIIEITKCLNLDGIEQALAERGESTIPFTFTGHQTEDEATGQLLSPFRVWFFDADGNMETYANGAVVGSMMPVGASAFNESAVENIGEQPKKGKND